ncbi:MAG: sigma-70 family RNA polymerase sigma factor [Planctomycetaceae bacterium]|nr:sigma-70 family RNA polymerase sigma factor [Planctomycetaceae bacterium]
MTQLHILFDQIYAEMSDLLRGYVRRRLLPVIWSQYGDDIVQESFFRLTVCWECRDNDGEPLRSLDGTLAEVRPLLYKIAFRVMQESIRTFKRQEHDCIEMDAVAAEDPFCFAEAENRLQTAHDLCSEQEWEILKWIAFKDPSSSDIGKRLGLTPQGARSRIHRLRRRLREAVKHEWM